MELNLRARMELKYCECCGGLLLRTVGSDSQYCGGCAARLREMAPPKVQGKKRGRPPKAANAAQTEVTAEPRLRMELEAVAAGTADWLAASLRPGDEFGSEAGRRA